MLVDINLAFGTAKNVQIGSSPGGTGEVSPNTTVNTRNTAQSSSSILSTRKIGDWQLVRFADGANASNGVPAFVYKIKDAYLLRMRYYVLLKRELRNQIRMLSLHSCNSCIKRTTLDTQLKSQSC